MIELYEMLKRIDGGHVLDVATGKGYFIKAFIQRFKRVTQITAVDIAIDIDKMQAKFSDVPVTFRETDAGRLPYADAFFDTVCISNSLHHLPQPDCILGEMYRVLKNGGNFIVNEMFGDDQCERQRSHVAMHHWKEAVSRSLDDVPGRETMARNNILALIEKIPLSAYEVLEYDFEVVENAESKYDYSLEDCRELFDEIDGYMRRLDDHPEHRDLAIQGAKLKKRIVSVGFAPASSLFIVGIK